MRRMFLPLLASLTLVSCEVWTNDSELGYFDVCCANNSDDSVYVLMYGHELGDTSNNVLRLYCDHQNVEPRNISTVKLILNWELESRWENIWYGYGIDTLYAIVSLHDIPVSRFLPLSEMEKLSLPKGDGVLKTLKYTRSYAVPEENKIMIFYP